MLCCKAKKLLISFKNFLSQLVVHGLNDADMVAVKKVFRQKQNRPEGARLAIKSRDEPAYFIEIPNNNGDDLEVDKP